MDNNFYFKNKMNIADLKAKINIYDDLAIDINGNKITNGSLCICGITPKFMRYENDTLIIDYSELNDLTGFRHANGITYFMSDGDRTAGLYNAITQFAVFEYFDISDDPDKVHLYPFIHQPVGLQFKFWINIYGKGPSYICVRNAKNIKVRYALYEKLLNIIKSFLKKGSKIRIDEKNHYFEINAFDMYLVASIKKILRGVELRSKWQQYSGKFPKIYMNVNESDENKFSEVRIMTHNFGFYEFYAADFMKVQKNLKIYCKHPIKNHNEYFYKFLKEKA